MRPKLSIGFVLVPDFTMLAFAAFVDALRLAADEGDRSRPIDCRWTVMSESGGEVRASNGVAVRTDGRFVDPAQFDYIVVVGGTLHRGEAAGEATLDYLRAAAAACVPLAGICTGSFVLARAGLLAGHRCCVSWFHKAEFESAFPDLDVRAGQLFVIDRDRITCAGGTGVIHLASALIEKHVGAGASAKGLRIMIEERRREASAPQPLPALDDLPEAIDARVARAILLIEHGLAAPQPAQSIAAAVGTTERHLRRLFRSETGASMGAIRARLRLAAARKLVIETDLSMIEIAFRTGFADASHFTRSFREHFDIVPSDLRTTCFVA